MIYLVIVSSVYLILVFFFFFFFECIRLLSLRDLSISSDSCQDTAGQERFAVTHISPIRSCNQIRILGSTRSGLFITETRMAPFSCMVS
jgi:hypothetical protein